MKQMAKQGVGHSQLEKLAVEASKKEKKKKK